MTDEITEIQETFNLKCRAGDGTCEGVEAFKENVLEMTFFVCCECGGRWCVEIGGQFDLTKI